MRNLERPALRRGVPVEDEVLIAVNLYGITSDQDHHRARVNLRLVRRPTSPGRSSSPEPAGQPVPAPGRRATHTIRSTTREPVRHHCPVLCHLPARHPEGSRRVARAGISGKEHRTLLDLGSGTGQVPWPWPGR
ncbi:hypothetical protein NKH18_49080 [Streptomyces sp. M10(2022)]